MEVKFFATPQEFNSWLEENHQKFTEQWVGFYKVKSGIPSMTWSQSVDEALCYGWIDSTVKSLGNGKRRQYFTPRKPKSVWSALNKRYIKELSTLSLIHESGFTSIKIAKQNGSWTALDNVEKGIIPSELQQAFDDNPTAFNNYKNFAPSYKKGYLYWLNSAKREETRLKRIEEIIKFCKANVKSRDNW